MADCFAEDVGAEDAAMPAEVGRWLRTVLAEVQLATSAVAAGDVARFDEALLRARRVYVAGQGRSGLVARAFAQRLMHIGFESYAVGDIISPAVGAADVFIAVTASGRTETTVSQAANAKAAGATIVTLTEMESGDLVDLSELRLLVPTRPPRRPETGAPCDNVVLSDSSDPVRRGLRDASAAAASDRCGAQRPALEPRMKSAGELKVDHRRIWFVGVRTQGSAALSAFPGWMGVLREDIRLQGVDLPLDTDAPGDRNMCLK